MVRNLGALPLQTFRTMKHLLALSLALLAPACVLGPADCSGSVWVAGDGAGPRLEGSGVAGSQAKDVAEFRAVRLEGSFDVRATVGEARSVVVEGDDNLLEHVRARVEDGVFVLDFAPGRYRTHLPMKVAITSPTLTAFEVEGAGDVELVGVRGERFGLSIRGAGDVTASGAVETLDVAISGAGDANLLALDSKRASVSISGAGDVSLSVSERLDVSVSGVGDVSYRGSPQVAKGVSGAGSVRRID